MISVRDDTLLDLVKFDRIKKLYVKRLVPSRNSLYTGYVGSDKFFIKSYGVRKGKEKIDLLKVRCELLCYKNIKSLNLPNVIEADYRKRRLVLEFAAFKKVGASKRSIDGILDFQSRIVNRIDASFLPQVTYSYYKNSLHKNAVELRNKGIIKDLDTIFDRFERDKKTIDESAKYFSHGDLHLSNMKYLNGKLMMIDLEYARRDNLMCDLAAIYADMSDRKLLADYFMKKMSKLDYFNNELFTSMLCRRCIEVLYALKNNPGSQPYKNAKELMERNQN